MSKYRFVKVSVAGLALLAVSTSVGCGWLVRGAASRAGAATASRQAFVRAVETSETLATGAAVGLAASEAYAASNQGPLSSTLHRPNCQPQD